MHMHHDSTLSCQFVTVPAGVGTLSRSGLGMCVRYPLCMRIIDFHTHVFPDALAPSAVAMLASQGGINPHYDGTVTGLLAAMDRADIATSVVQPVATKPDQVRTINDWVAALASDRIVAFGAMHPDVEDPATEIARMHALGIRGFKMHPEYQSFEPHEPRLEPIFAAAAGHRMIAFFHAGGDVGFDTVRGTARSFAKVLDAFPGLTVVLAHMGGFRQWDSVGESVAGRDVWLDTAFTPGHLPDADLVELMRAHGSERVLFGSDGPWTDAAGELAHIRTLGLTDEELAGVLGKNAERLLAAHR